MCLDSVHSSKQFVSVYLDDVLICVVTGDNSIIRLTMCISNNVLYIS